MPPDDDAWFARYVRNFETVLACVLVGALAVVIVWSLPAWPWIVGGVRAAVREAPPVVVVSGLCLAALLVIVHRRRA